MMYLINGPAGGAGGQSGGSGNGFGSNTGGFNSGGGGYAGGGGGFGGGNNVCFSWGKVGHFARDCWSRRTRGFPSNYVDPELEEIKEQHRLARKERLELEEKRRVEDERKAREEDDARRNADFARKAEEFKLQLRAELVEEWRKKEEEAKKAVKRLKQASKSAITRRQRKKGGKFGKTARKIAYSEMSDESDSDTGDSDTSELQSSSTSSDDSKRGRSVECAISVATLLLVIRGQIPWLEKYVRRSEEVGKLLDLKTGGVYAIVSPWTTKSYVGSTVRPMIHRWREHCRNAQSDALGLAPHLYRWLRKYGVDKYTIIPLNHSDKGDDYAFERFLIEDLYPSLNTREVGKEGKHSRRRARRGRRERRGRSGEARVQKVVTFVFQGATYTSLLVRLAEHEGRGRWTLVFSGGDVWTDRWRNVVKKYGNTVLMINGKKTTLHEAKRELQQGREVTFILVVRSKTTTGKNRTWLIGLLRKPRPVVAKFLRTRVRIVWIRNRNVGELLHNQKLFASEEQHRCPCKELALPKLDGHILTRFSEIEVPRFVGNSKNITRPAKACCMPVLVKAILEAVKHVKGSGTTQVTISSAWADREPYTEAWTDEEILKGVEYDLEHSFVRCGGRLVKQIFGIPMGKSMSPILASVTCAVAKMRFLRQLGTERRFISGWRIMDDITVIVGVDAENSSGGFPESFFKAFEDIYDDNLEVIRKP
ncbi:hypothetical protein CBR_g19708 [Chara braunii]|uniref:GIY-YIG domain-containing protein n=1 Tax=Chara braunii TaxID=69332 RepID=A0A388KYR9_CHABU|nr:hypothetical protein CBR_g19708 [Chara braunii]|eukprot:GBG75195.1 hypothetical protein CBR_g19708 [Chara braunii]